MSAPSRLELNVHVDLKGSDSNTHFLSMSITFTVHSVNNSAIRHVSMKNILTIIDRPGFGGIWLHAGDLMDGLY